MANTPNYNLYKPNRLDNLAVDTTLANNFTIIDTEIKNVDLRINSEVSSLDSRISNIIASSGTSDTEVVDARGEYFGILGERLDSTDSQIGDLIETGINLLPNPNFDVLPPLSIRSTVYTITPNVTTPQQIGKNTLKIQVTNYESSADVNKDFAFLLGEQLNSTDQIRISFWVYPSVSSKVIQIRMAYSGAGISVNLGPANQWNKVDATLYLSDMTQVSNYLFFNMNSSFTMHLSDFRVNHVQTTKIPVSLNQVNEKLTEKALVTQNSTGILERLIRIGQTYLDNVNQFVYGNSYTAYDKDLTQVGGKYQIDCSSFANLLIHGVPFENSRYSGNSSNVGSRLFYQNIDGYKFRYANQIAKYAFDKGFSFVPNSDFSNLQPGDVLFFNWDNSGTGGTGDGTGDVAFMGIEHVGVFLHKKNENTWSTLQFDNGISTVFYDASNGYMNQCVLAARFPYANTEDLYDKGNLLLDGNAVRNVTGVTTIYTYKVAKPLVQGRYYTFAIDGNVLTPNCYFILQVNGQTVYSDSGKVLPYSGVSFFKFPYTVVGNFDTITLLIGAPNGTSSSRDANVNWCSLHEGYVRNKKDYIRAQGEARIIDFPLDPTLVSDLNGGMAPYYKYGLEGNKLFINFSLPFNTLRTGSVTLGTIADPPKTTQRIPCNVIGASNEAINAFLQISSGGSVTIQTYTSVQWKFALVNGCIFRV